MPSSMPQPIPQFNGRLASPTPQTKKAAAASHHQQPSNSKNPFPSSDLEWKSPHIPELSVPVLKKHISNPDEISSINLDEVYDSSQDEGASCLQPSSETFDIDDRVFFDKNGTLRWKGVGTYVVLPGAIGGAGRWIRQEVKLQSQPEPPVASNMWLSTGFYYSVVLGFIAAIIGNFVLARLILKIDKNKLTYLGLSLIFGMFYSTVFAMGGQAVFSSEGKIDQNQAVALASKEPKVQQKAINSNQAIAENSTDPDVKEEAIESSTAIATSDTATPEVKGQAIEASRDIAISDTANSDVRQEAIQASQAIATSSDDIKVKRDAIEATQAIATDENADTDVQQEAIEASQKIALNSDDVHLQEQAIDTTVAIFEATEDSETQIVAVQALSDLAVNGTETTADDSIRQEALAALGKIKINVENLDQAVIDEINTAQITIEKSVPLD